MSHCKRGPNGPLQALRPPLGGTQVGRATTCKRVRGEYHTLYGLRRRAPRLEDAPGAALARARFRLTRPKGDRSTGAAPGGEPSATTAREWPLSVFAEVDLCGPARPPSFGCSAVRRAHNESCKRMRACGRLSPNCPACKAALCADNEVPTSAACLRALAWPTFVPSSPYAGKPAQRSCLPAGQHHTHANTINLLPHLHSSATLSHPAVAQARSQRINPNPRPPKLPLDVARPATTHATLQVLC